MGKGRTFVIVREDEPKCIIGFVTLRTSSLITDDNKPFEGRPAVEITELAVDARFAKQGYGRMLVGIAFDIIDTMREKSAGVEFVTLCSDSQSVPFYEHIGFRKAATYYHIPREGWNRECTPMIWKLPELNLTSFGSA
jgi:ribosomal protein S18 acetylase RimI-like enzyme